MGKFDDLPRIMLGSSMSDEDVEWWSDILRLRTLLDEIEDACAQYGYRAPELSELHSAQLDDALDRLEWLGAQVAS